MIGLTSIPDHLFLLFKVEDVFKTRRIRKILTLKDTKSTHW